MDHPGHIDSTNWQHLFNNFDTDVTSNISSLNLSLLVRNHNLDNYIDPTNFTLDFDTLYRQQTAYTRRITLDFSDLRTIHDPSLWHLQINGIYKEVTFKLWHLLRLETYKSMTNNSLQTFILKTCAELLPTLHQKKRRYGNLYPSDDCLYCSLAPDSQQHWITCLNMQHLWQSTLHRTLLRLMMYIKMEVDPNSTFYHFLATFDDLSSHDTYVLYKDLMHGRILHSDLAAIRKRIFSTHKFNMVNLGARFLYFFFQSFRTILWMDHNNKVLVWESFHNISKQQRIKSYRSTALSSQPTTITSNTATIQSRPSTTNANNNHLALQYTKDFLDSLVSSGITAGWGFIRFGRSNFFL